jgi:hypothetical protein
MATRPGKRLPRRLATSWKTGSESSATNARPDLTLTTAVWRFFVVWWKPFLRVELRHSERCDINNAEGNLRGEGDGLLCHHNIRKTDVEVTAFWDKRGDVNGFPTWYRGAKCLCENCSSLFVWIAEMGRLVEIEECTQPILQERANA